MEIEGASVESVLLFVSAVISVLSLGFAAFHPSDRVAIYGASLAGSGFATLFLLLGHPILSIAQWSLVFTGALTHRFFQIGAGLGRSARLTQSERLYWVLSLVALLGVGLGLLRVLPLTSVDAWTTLSDDMPGLTRWFSENGILALHVLAVGGLLSLIGIASLSGSREEWE